MKKPPFADLRGLLAKGTSSVGALKTFGKLPSELVEMYCANSLLILMIDRVSHQMPEKPEEKEFETIKARLEENGQSLLDTISRLAERKLVVHETADGDTLWKLSRQYNSEVYEISELNGVTNIFLPFDKKILLIPLRYQ